MQMDATQLSQEVNDCRRRAEQLVNGMLPDQLTRRADPAKWSVAECIAHLNLTAKVVQKIVRKGVAQSRAQSNRSKASQGPFPLGARGRLLIWIAEPPPKFRIPAPKSIAPPLAIDNPSGLLPEFMRAQDEWERLMKDADGLDISRITLGNFLSPFRCRMSGGMLWMMAHQRRHLWQAENVKKQLTGA
jgi:hypothetical protein